MLLLNCFSAWLIVSPLLAWPNIHSQVKKDLKRLGKGEFLITFKPADTSLAHSPEQMFSMAKLSKGLAMLNVNSMGEFVEKGHYHKCRGDYVFSSVQLHHEACKKIMMSYLDDGAFISSIPISNTFLVRAKKIQVRGLAMRPDVVEIFSNKAFKVDLPEEALQAEVKELAGHVRGMAIHDRAGAREEKASVQWNVMKINAPRCWTMDANVGRGEGITYASADTGVAYKHPSIRSNYKGLKPNGSYDHNYCWYDGVRKPVGASGHSSCGYSSPVPCDDQGHGTHVMSTAVGQGGFGVAPGASWIACRNMDAGLGSPETYLTCLNFFLAPHDLNGNNPDPNKRPHVVGNSYGCPDSEGCSPHAMTAAVEALRAAGIFMSVSAGNNGPDCGTITDPPAIEPMVVSCGATDRNDVIARFSSRGPVKVDGKTYIKPDVSAPGADILAADSASSGYKRLSGTSMASPHLSGLAVLMSAHCPCIARNIDQMEYFIEMTAVPLAARSLCELDQVQAVPNNTYGWGRIDAAAAINACREYCRAQQ